MIRSLLIATLFSFAAHAEDPGSQNTEAGPSSSVGSEYLHQATGQHFELSPAVGIIGRRVEYKSTTAKSNYTLFPILVKGEYGFTDMFSLSAVLGVGFGVTDNSCDAPAICKDTISRGAIDPQLSANFRIPVGIAALRFGADLWTSFGKHKIDDEGDTNLATGGSTLAPYFGADFALADMVFGFKLAYDLWKSDREIQDDTSTPSTYKKKGGNETDFTVFYEFNFPRIVSIGTAFQFTDSPTFKTESAGVTTSDKNAANVYDLSVYVPLRFTPRVTLVPSVSVGSVDYKNSTTVKEQTNSSLAAYARFTF